jgi:monoamine oxidase
MRRRNPNRADFVHGAMASAAGALLAPSFTTGTAFARGRERVAIVGAGIAGLSCALVLRDAGIDAAVYESSARVGGRMHSESSYWDDGQHTEWCGSMIDSDHHTLLALARRFGLPLVDTLSFLKPHARDTAFIGGSYYEPSQMDRDFGPVYRVLQQQLAGIGKVTTYDSATPLARELDAISMAQWLERYVPGGRASRFARLIEDGLANEYGIDATLQSSLNLVYMLGAQPVYGEHGKMMNVLGYSDQRFNIGTGNQQLPTAMSRALAPGSIRFGRRLLAIRKRPGGDYELRFSSAHGEERVYYDRVVLAIPFIALRGVDYASAGFDARKQRAIDTLGYGVHTKLHVQFHGRPWERSGAPWFEPLTGQIWTDTGFQDSVDFTLGQHGSSGIIERFTYGTAGLIDVPPMPYARIGDSPAVEARVHAFFEQLDRIWPGVSRAWNGKATVGNAQADPNILASYSCWLVGQYTSIAGYEQVRQGRVHFAGEHCSVNNQGFMEGGAETGVTAAREILADYGVRG